MQVFQCLEHPDEQQRLKRISHSLKHRKRNLVERIVNNTDIVNLEEVVWFELSEYEKLLEDAFSEGFDTSSYDQEISDLEKWTLMKSVFFSSTVITTIGNATVNIYMYIRSLFRK